jgi:site-specific DNA recombinase
MSNCFYCSTALLKRKEGFFMRVVCYARVSTREQAEKGWSIGEQQERMQAYCSAKEWTMVRLITDPGYSGAKLDRPGMNELVALVKNHDCDAVLVWKLDRLSRSQKDTLYLIEDVFTANGCSFISMNENFDTSTAFGRAMIGILSVFAQLEREQIRERMAVGRVGRAKAGLFHGGGFAPIGYDYITKEDGGQGLVVNENEAMQVREVFRLFLDGWSLYKIHLHMKSNYTLKYGVWTDRTVRDVLRFRLYIGKITWAGVEYDGRHEHLVSDEVFAAAQRRLDAVKWVSKDGESRQKSPFESTHVLGGLLWCARCGARYGASGNYSGRGENRRYHPYYACYSRSKSAKNMIRDPNCKNNRWPCCKLDGIVLDAIRELAFDPAAFEAIVHPEPDVDVDAKRAALTSKMTDLEAQKKRLLDLCQLGAVAISEVADRLEDLDAQFGVLRSELEDCVVPASVQNVDIEVSRATLASAAAVIENGTQLEKRELVHALISRIDMDGDKMDIHWRFAPQQ